jgi:hypothetical protein
MRWVWGGLVTVAVAVVVLFAVQNSSRTTQLSLDLGFTAWQLERAVPIPALLGITFLGGLVLGAVPMWVRSLRSASRVRELESQQALGQALGKDDPRAPGAW